MDRVRRLEFLAERSASYKPPFPFQRRDSAQGQSYDRQASLISYECPVCGRYQALPYNKQGYRCLSDGMSLHRVRPYDRSRTRGRDHGFGRELAL